MGLVVPHQVIGRPSDLTMSDRHDEVDEDALQLTPQQQIEQLKAVLAQERQRNADLEAKCQCVAQEVQRTEAELQRATQDLKRATQDRQRATQDRQRATQDRQRATQDHQRATQNRKRATKERQHAEAKYERSAANCRRVVAECQRAVAKRDRAEAECQCAEAELAIERQLTASVLALDAKKTAVQVRPKAKAQSCVEEENRQFVGVSC